MPDTTNQDFRCVQENCGSLLFKGTVVNARIEIQCKRCGTKNRFHIEPRERVVQEHKPEGRKKARR